MTKQQYIVFQRPKSHTRGGLMTAVMVVDATSKKRAIELALETKPDYFNEKDKWYCKVQADLLQNWAVYTF